MSQLDKSSMQLYDAQRRVTVISKVPESKSFVVSDKKDRIKIKDKQKNLGLGKTNYNRRASAPNLSKQDVIGKGQKKFFKFKYTSIAAIAQLGERQTEDLKVPGSIPGGGILFLFLFTPTKDVLQTMKW